MDIITSKSNECTDISFVILTWNSAKYIDRCIKSYALSVEKECINAEFLIVDNGSSDSTVDIIESELFPSLPKGCVGRLYKLNKNMGTTKSRNLALRSVVSKYIVICDSDTEYKSGDWKKMLMCLDNDEVGMIAPNILYPDGTVQNSVKKIPTILEKLLKLGKILFHFSKWSYSDFYKDFPWETINPTDTAISAFWILKKTILESVGYLDEKIFYSPEDIDYCVRIWKSGKKIFYYPFLKIVHHTQQISHKNPFSRLALSHFFGLLYFFNKHKYFFSREKLKSHFIQRS
jgi:GT2 family glycosyltransferase